MTNQRRFVDTRLVVASHNTGKVREIVELMNPLGIATVSAAELGLGEPNETGATFVANAVLKAKAAAESSGLPALADDSGLVIAALDGAPGIHSARWAGPERDFRVAMERVEKALQAKGATDQAARRAAFVCVLALAWPDGHVATYEGRVEGTIVWPPRGERGFGYDPVFMPDGHQQTFGEMEPASKHAMSHRARAFEQMMDHVFRPDPDRT